MLFRSRITITADALNKVLADERLSWRFDGAKSSGELGDLFKSLNSAFKAFNGSTILYFNMGTTVYSNEKYTNMFFIRLKLKAAGRYLNITLKYSLELTGNDEVKFVFGEMDKNMATYVDKVPALKALLEKLANTTIKCSSSSLIAPVEMSLTDSQNTSSSLVVNIQ